MNYANPRGVYHIYETPDAETGYCALARKATPEKWIEATPDAVPVCKRCLKRAYVLSFGIKCPKCEATNIMLSKNGDRPTQAACYECGYKWVEYRARL